MRFKLQTDYALQALTFMACKAGGNCTTDEIAAYFQISAAHLGRVIRRLQRYGFVKAIRGRRGGVRLAKDPQSFTVGEVVNRLEEGAEPLDDMVGLQGSSPDTEFRLRAVVRRGHGAFLNYLEKVAFSELAADGLPPAPAPRVQPVVVQEAKPPVRPTVVVGVPVGHSIHHHHHHSVPTHHHVPTPAPIMRPLGPGL